MTAVLMGNPGMTQPQLQINDGGDDDFWQRMTTQERAAFCNFAGARTGDGNMCFFALAEVQRVDVFDADAFWIPNVRFALRDRVPLSGMSRYGCVTGPEEMLACPGLFGEPDRGEDTAPVWMKRITYEERREMEDKYGPCGTVSDTCFDPRSIFLVAERLVAFARSIDHLGVNLQSPEARASWAREHGEKPSGHLLAAIALESWFPGLGRVVVCALRAEQLGATPPSCGGNFTYKPSPWHTVEEYYAAFEYARRASATTALWAFAIHVGLIRKARGMASRAVV
jgi:hypothetical protein